MSRAWLAAIAAIETEQMSYAPSEIVATGVVDSASGDRHPGDGTLGTFNPLFPNGYYFTLAAPDTAPYSHTSAVHC